MEINAIPKQMKISALIISLDFWMKHLKFHSAKLELRLHGPSASMNDLTAAVLLVT